MKAKKIVVLLMAFVMVCGIFAGCANTNENKTTETTASATTEATGTAAETSPAAQITLTTWDGGEEGEWKTFYENLYAEFMKKYPNIKIQQVNASKEGPDGGGMNLQAALAAGTGPALLNWVPTVQYAKNGYIVPLDDYMKDWPDAKDLNQDIMQMMKFQGKTYCLPSMFSYATPNCIYYRKDNAVAAGIDISKEPKTWAEFEDWMKKFSDKGFKSLMDVGYCFNFQEANGGRRDEKDAEGNVKFVMNSPQNIETYQFIQGLFKKGYVDLTEPKSSQSYLDKFITGKAGFMIENFGQLGRSLMPAGLTDAEVGIIGFPAKDGPAKATSMGSGNTAINGTLSKEKQDAAWELMKFVVGSKDTFKNIIWPHQKKVDYRPIMLTAFTDMQEEYFKALDVDPKYSEKIAQLSTNLLINNNIPYNDLWQVVTGTDEAIYLDNKDPKTTLDALAEKITKEVMEPENKRVKEEKFYKELKEKESK